MTFTKEIPVMGGSPAMLFCTPPPACRPSTVVPLANAVSASKAAATVGTAPQSNSAPITPPRAPAHARSPIRVLPNRCQKRRQDSKGLPGCSGPSQPSGRAERPPPQRALNQHESAMASRR
jgi:hypothetical protein